MPANLVQAMLMLVVGLAALAGNLVERWFGELTTELLRRGQHRSVRQLNTEIRQWIDDWNDNPRPYVWTKTAEQILDSIKHYCERTNEARH